MPGYRLFFHDRKGKIYHSVELIVDTDEEAMREAKMINHVRPIEVWRGDVCVGVVQAAN